VRSDASLVPTSCNTMQQNATLIANRRVVSQHGGPGRVPSTNMHKDAHRKRSWPPGRGHGRNEMQQMQRVWQDRWSRYHGSVRAAIRWSIHKRAQQCTSERYGEPPTRNSNATECDTMQHFSRFCSREIGITHSAPVRAAPAAGRACRAGPTGRSPKISNPPCPALIDLPRRKRSRLNRC